MGETNSDVMKEQKRVDDVVQEIDKKKEHLEHQTHGLRGDIIDIRKNFWEDITVNLDEPDDVVETHASIKQQAEFLAERERSHGQYYRQMKTLDKLKNSPYFGRIDFKENGIGESESVYLGIASLMDSDHDDFLIYDWRAPISSLYYDFTPGDAHYETPGGIIEGDMELKRQFIIRNSVIKSMFDTGITIGDELLQEVLGNHADNQMKTIVATIQKEQNAIIRNEKSKLLIVQGVAGSGKTSAALQRVAYLLYRYRKTLNANNIVLFSPNPLFNSYISTVLPELGEQNMEQTTFQEYLEATIGKYFNLEDPFSQVETTLNHTNTKEYDVRLAGIQFKATLCFKEMIDKFVKQLSDHDLKFRNIKFKDEVIIPSNEIAEYFYTLDQTHPVPNRLEIVREWLLKRLRKTQREERRKEWVDLEISLLDKEDYLHVYQEVQRKYSPKEDVFTDYDEEEKVLRKMVVNRHFKSLKKKIKQLDFLNLQANYRQLFEKNNHVPLESDVPKYWNEICTATINMISQKALYYEDATPFLYFKEQLEGKKPNMAIRHVFIDEAQDYSPFQFDYIKGLFPNTKMTVLGDFNQAIYPHTLNAQAFLSQNLYKENEQEKIELTKSYRSTFEIIEFARHIITSGANIDPFNRHGDLPSVTKANEANYQEIMMEKIKFLQKEGYDTVAIICKTAKESRNVYDTLKNQTDVQLITKETGAFTKGQLILPAYLAKGIEFDAVILNDVSEERYSRDSERKLLYTACTRAMHDLHIITIGDLSPLLNNIPQENYHYQAR